MARKSGPALYELMRRGGASADPGAARPSAGGKVRDGGLQPFAGSDAKWLAWASVFVVALVAAYFVGVTRGERVGRAQAIAEREEELRLLSEGRPSTPPTAQVPAAQQQPDRSASSAGASENQASGASGALAQNGLSEPIDPNFPPLPPAPAGLDPRQSGLNYFVIAAPPEGRADDIVRFCRERGLDAYAVVGDTARLREVVVLPGFPKSELSGPAATQLKKRIRAVGVLHKAAVRGNPDFGDMYPKLYQR
jgi:hypothetical protein